MSFSFADYSIRGSLGGAINGAAQQEAVIDAVSAGNRLANNGLTFVGLRPARVASVCGGGEAMILDLRATHRRFHGTSVV
jgi:subtilisin family serine protease